MEKVGCSGQPFFGAFIFRVSSLRGLQNYPSMGEEDVKYLICIEGGEKWMILSSDFCRIL